MRRLIVLTVLLVLGLTVTSGQVHPSAGGWVRLLGSSGDVDVNGWDIAVDAEGNSYIIGDTEEDLDGNTNAGSSDIFVAKYDTHGNKQWTRLLGTSEFDSGRDIAVDSEGNSTITGYTEGDLDGNSNAGLFDIFVAKYDTDGNKQWTKLLGTSSDDHGESIVLDSQGNSYITGRTYGALDGHTNAGVPDIFVAKYDTQGEKQWLKQFGTPEGDFGWGIAVDSSGNSYITGYTFGDLDGESNAGLADIFAAKYDTGGNKQWTRLLGTSDTDEGFGIALDSSGNCYITGRTSGALDGNIYAGLADIFIAKYDTDGHKQWIEQLGTPSDDWGFDIAVDADGRSRLTGYTEGDLDGNTNAGEADIFVAKYDTDGDRQWTRLLGSPSVDVGFGIVLDSRGNNYITGPTGGDLGGNSNVGGRDIFVWKLVPAKGMPWLFLLLDE